MQAQIQDPSDPTKSFSLDQVSKLFSLPLSDAAHFLGVSTSVLKTISYEHGLVRWPYRKFVAGKSIDEIKREAITEKTRRLANPPVIAGESSVQEMSKSLNLEQPQSQGTKSLLVSGNMLSSNFTRGLTANTDEFKYGFPSDGLSTISFRWWEDGYFHDGNRGTQLSDFIGKKESENPDRIGSFEGKGSENEVQARTNNAPTTGSLSDLRSKAVKEGKAALKLGVYKGHGLNKLDRNRRSTLVQIFKSSLPSQWEHGLS